MKELEEILGYTFKDKALLARAVSTPAVRMADPKALDNQRLEFLGDAVFGLLAADRVFAEHHAEQEGLLTVRRTHLVSGAALAAAAEKLELRRFLRRNPGAQELPPRAKVLADALEAVMGAVWLDGGLAAAQALFARLDLPFHEKLNEWDANPKGYLQVKAQAMRPRRQPRYAVENISGTAHEPCVTVRVTVEGLGTAVAQGVGKTAAEVAAAAALLAQLSEEA